MRLALALILLSAVVMVFALAAMWRARAADDATEEALGDLPALPKGLLRGREATFRDVTITNFHRAENSRG